MSELPVVATFVTKRHSRRPYLRLQVNDSDGNPFDFTGAVSVTFLMYTEAGVEKVDYAGVIESPPTLGILKYQWLAADVNTAGNFSAEFDVDWGAGETQTIPLDGVLRIRINEDLDNA